MICYCCCRQSSQKPSIELQKSFKPYLEAVKFNPSNPQAHNNAPSLNALDVATLNPRYVYSLFHLPAGPADSSLSTLSSFFPFDPNTNLLFAITASSPSTTTSRMPTLPREQPRRNNGTLVAPALPPRCWTPTAPRSTRSQTKCQAITRQPLVAQTLYTTHKQVTFILQDLAWA